MYCSEAELDALSETLYTDGKLAVQQAALYLLQQEDDEERNEPPGRSFSLLWGEKNQKKQPKQLHFH